MAKLSKELNYYFFEQERGEKVSLLDILDLAGERIFGFLFLILALPSALPVPAPGYGTVFGIIILFLGIQFLIGRHTPWLPKSIVQRSMNLKLAQSLVKKAIPWLERIEKVTKPRMGYICNSFPGRILIGMAIILMACSMCLIIPGTNTLPAIGIFVTAFGLLESDGLIVIGGLFIGSLALTLTGAILIFGKVAVEKFIDLIKSYLIR